MKAAPLGVEEESRCAQAAANSGGGLVRAAGVCGMGPGMFFPPITRPCRPTGDANGSGCSCRDPLPEEMWGWGPHGAVRLSLGSPGWLGMGWDEWAGRSHCSCLGPHRGHSPTHLPRLLPAPTSIGAAGTRDKATQEKPPPALAGIKKAKKGDFSPQPLTSNPPRATSALQRDFQGDSLAQ